MLLVEVAREFSRRIRAEVIPVLQGARDARNPHNPYAVRARAMHAMSAYRDYHCQHKPEEGFDRTTEMSARVTLGKRTVLYMRDWPIGEETGLGEGTGVFKPRNVITNVPEPGFVIVDLVKVGNMGIIVGGCIDAFQWSDRRDAARPGGWFDLPTMTRATALTLFGTYTGLVPNGFKEGDEFEFKITLKGIEPKKPPKKTKAAEARPTSQ